MTLEDIEAIMARQSELIAALDALDPAAITQASEALAAALSTGRGRLDLRHDPVLPERVGRALEQANAAAMRTNTLLHWTRQRIGKIAELRGTAINERRISY